jgi:NAD(P)H-nitrite reductase large subunit
MTPPKGKIVCDCLQVTESQILKAIETRRLGCVKDITDYTSAGDGCTACHPLLKEYLQRRHAKAAIS